MIDITRPLGSRTAVWPGDTPFDLDWTMHVWRGDSVSVSRISMSPHVGTHADAPAHFRSGGATTGSFDLAAFVGRVRVIDACGSGSIDLAVFEDGGALGCSRVLVRVLKVVHPEEFVHDFPALAAEAAEALVGNGLRLYGTDAPSVDPVDSSRMSAHRVLGEAGVPILENLDLTQVAPGDYDLIALPLKLEAAEAAPLRAVLLPPGSLASSSPL